MPSSGTIFLNVFLGLLVLVPLLLAFVVKAEIERIDRALADRKADQGGSQSPPARVDAGAETAAGEAAVQPPAAEDAPRPEPPPVEVRIEPKSPRTGGVNLPRGDIRIVAINTSGLIIRGLLWGMQRRRRKRETDTSSES